ncbi:coiled-coil-helix-coiled-coil-helix domain-containing protein 7 isoform X2 [Vespa velutina]|uniref:coiled-coil-helix-coiled-coil-helix domain-containing protein 7 isoform X2 n=1 Tax=Vespa velutina TaxID=202808 RepID=UPI001FB4AD60|nr:coiled-coil-helix-coiled-coil-helix domain-containing protein 7 isoform X2 [Vespa velutina]XP_047358118.1 coiled-coil-helix-coiled-coil-helix domain-containing protein 7 isoform X2 [Vespa velutina]
MSKINDTEINTSKEHDLSLQCLSDNNYIRDACQDYFQNYRICQKFWKKIVVDRKRKNIKPYLPSPEDRENVKNEYLKFNIK